ncbi:hypothetical protein Nepgr_013386 [Nepenthes gracilis]|uniref:YTH domain-containing family protein n=1 Tax=Nepenthes gracilis TaxID=150966 RepID=A0AAD3SIR7_NEPGR|nr:hypothetical protein Nepgr_013386 [Nepenthes gracilis]
MATVATPADQAAGLLQSLSLDSQTKTKTNLTLSEPTMKLPSSQIDFKDASNDHIHLNERSATPLLPDVMDPSLCYPPNSYIHAAYYYGGYDVSGNDWDDYSRYVNPDGAEIPPGVYGDNGSLMYHHGLGFAPYGPYSPAGSSVAAMGHDSQLYGHQQYQYPSPYFQPVTPTSGTYTPAPAAHPQGDMSSAAAGQWPLSAETANGNANCVSNDGGKGRNGSVPLRATHQTSYFDINNSYGRGSLPGGLPTSGYQDPRFGFDGIRSPIPWFDGPFFADGQPRTVTSNSFASLASHANHAPSSRNQSLPPHANVLGLHQPKLMSGLGTAHGFTNQMYASKFYGRYGNTVRINSGYGSNGYDARTSDRGCFGVDSRYRNRGRGNAFFGYGSENMDGLNELNRGPRAKSSKNQKGFAPITLAVRGQNITPHGNHNEERGGLNMILDREQFNCPDFPESYPDAKFFIIKSYSEDDVHKSIKYNVWSSTPNGNKKLDAAYQEAQAKSGDCPLFLLFSVNTSGQFVGIAEMVGPVDFHKDVEYWQQDKWNGSFPVQWRIVKDVPNSLLKHIILENNENKPVTTSRDTQEVKLEQGLQMLKIFKEHVSKTCILDDFGFYEVRQKIIQEKKAMQQQFQKQVWEGKSAGGKNKDGANEEQRLHISADGSDSIQEVKLSNQSNGDAKLSDNGGVVAKNRDVPKSCKLVVSDNILVNGVANGS